MTQKKEPTRIDQLEQGRWLYRMLGAVREDVAQQPTPAAIKRIESRLIEEMGEKREKKAAA